uniref:Uncharacterized protein n=1 Tax=Anopheles farauti TaxID=69004 RepID=A0A182Q0U6_9DIPT
MSRNVTRWRGEEKTETKTPGNPRHLVRINLIDRVAWFSNRPSPIVGSPPVERSCEVMLPPFPFGAPGGLCGSSGTVCSKLGCKVGTADRKSGGMGNRYRLAGRIRVDEVARVHGGMMGQIDLPAYRVDPRTDRFRRMHVK